MQVDTNVKTEGFGETQREAPTPEPGIRNVPRRKADGYNTKS